MAQNDMSNVKAIVQYLMCKYHLTYLNLLNKYYLFNSN